MAEIGQVFDAIDDTSVDSVIEQLANARRIVVFGAGREKLQVMGFAMRMFHLGMNVSVAGDMTTPAVSAGDVFLLSCGPGEFSTAMALMNVAHNAGATNILITAQPAGAASTLSDLTLTLPAQTMANDQGQTSSTTLPMGSAYEGALFILFEVLVLKLKHHLNVSAEAMRANHTNLE